MSGAGRLLRTVVHLAPGQVWHRARLRARRAWWERRPEAVDAAYRARAERLPPVRFDHPGLAAVARLRAARRSEAEALATARDALEGRFRFLGRSRELGREVDWYRPELDAGTRLWKTLLHEFPYAEDLARAERDAGDGRFRARLVALVESWQRASPIGRPDFALDAWNARAVATRLIHWAVAGCELELRAGEPLAELLSREIARHGLFLRDNLELDLRGNHLWRDAVGLLFADTLCGGIPDALAQLERQVAEQVLTDGCHVERAPMYHALCLQDLLESRLLLGADAPAWLDDALRRMGGFLETRLLGDGEIPLLGDGWLGEVSARGLVEATREAAGALARPGPDGPGGLVALRAGPLRAVLRAGPHGPDYLLGHAHADLLSFELSVGSARAVSDTGTLLYDPGPERQRLRSTAAHNTLEVDGAEQLETWSSFRVGRRGRARLVASGETQGWHWAWACHDAYSWLPGRPIHHRLLALCERAALVLDALLGDGTHALANRLHLHPECPELRVSALDGDAATQQAPLHERFGETRAMTRLCVQTRAALPWSGGWWIDLEAGSTPPGLRRDGAAIVVEYGAADAARPVARWSPGAPTASEAPSFALCPPARGSAT